MNFSAVEIHLTPDPWRVESIYISPSTWGEHTRKVVTSLRFRHGTAPEHVHPRPTKLKRPLQVFAGLAAFLISFAAAWWPLAGASTAAPAVGVARAGSTQAPRRRRYASSNSPI